MPEPTTTKKCCLCKEIKDFSEFTKYKNGKHGLAHRCRICKHLSDKRYYDSQKGQQRYANYRETDTFKQYIKSDNYKERHLVGARKYNKKHPDRIKAHGFINNLIKSKRIARPDTFICFNCTSPAKHYHHHLGYKKINWANVIPICIKCHNSIH